MEIIFLGVVCLGLAVYVMYLQRKAFNMQRALRCMAVVLTAIHDGKARVEIHNNAVRVVEVEKPNDRA